MLDPFRVRFRAAARALCGFSGELALGAGDVGDGNDEPGLEPVMSDEADIVLGPIGTVKLLLVGVDGPTESAALGRGTRFAGTLSAGGISIPRAAAMI